MTVQCPACKTRFPVDSRKIPDGGVHARCSKCHEVFFVEEQPMASTAAPQADFHPSGDVPETVEAPPELESGFQEPAAALEEGAAGPPPVEPPALEETWESAEPQETLEAGVQEESASELEPTGLDGEGEQPLSKLQEGETPPELQEGEHIPELEEGESVPALEEPESAQGLVEDQTEAEDEQAPDWAASETEGEEEHTSEWAASEVETHEEPSFGLDEAAAETWDEATPVGDIWETSAEPVETEEAGQEPFRTEEGEEKGEGEGGEEEEEVSDLEGESAYSGPFTFEPEPATGELGTSWDEGDEGTREDEAAEESEIHPEGAEEEEKEGEEKEDVSGFPGSSWEPEEEPLVHQGQEEETVRDFWEAPGEGPAPEMEIPEPVNEEAGSTLEEAPSPFDIPEQTLSEPEPDLPLPDPELSRETERAFGGPEPTSEESEPTFGEAEQTFSMDPAASHAPTQEAGQEVEEAFPPEEAPDTGQEEEAETQHQALESSAGETPPPPQPGAPPAATDLPTPRFGKRDPREKAQRLARVLVSDIILYNPDRHQRALEADRLTEEFEDEIHKSWNEYVEQVGEDVANETEFFTQALNEILAKGRKVF